MKTEARGSRSSPTPPSRSSSFRPARWLREIDMQTCEPVVYECEVCGTQFEAGIADPDPLRGPRCPQCFIARAHEVAPENVGVFVVRRGTPFR